MKHRLVGTCVFLTLFVAALLSQQGASVVGTVRDPTSAIVSGASVTLTELATRQTRSAVSDRVGTFRFDHLSPGEYQLSAASPGFKTYVETFKLKQETRRMDIVLDVGSTAESITVTDAAPLLRTESAEVAYNSRPSAPGQQGQASRAFAPQITFPGNRHPHKRVHPRYARDDEEYGHWRENEFSEVSAEPLSTFGVDVDTASYANVRRMLNEGRLPPPEAVRIEELVNYFRYAYPLPERGAPVSLTSDVVRSPWNHGRLLLRVGLRTQPVAAEDLPPSNLTFLVDVSGSMDSPDKLPLVQRALEMLVRQLRPQDHVSLVVYAGSSGVVLPPTPGNRRDVILQAIDRLSAGGSTHGSSGIQLAYRVARQSFRKGGNNRVILATDGDFNVGVTSDDELVRLIEEERDSGVFLSVVGFGTGNLKDAKMEKLADHGNGNYAYIDSLAEARKVFVEQMGATLVTVAKDVKLQIEFNPAQVASYRLIGYENRLLRPEDFNDDAKDAGDLGAGHQVTAFYEITPTASAGQSGAVDPLRYQSKPAAPPPQQSHAGELAWVKLRYKAPQSGTSQLLEWPVAGRSSAFADAPPDLRFAAAVAEYGMLLRHSKFAGSASFDHALRTASDALGADLDGTRTDFLDLVRKAAALPALRP